jgi:hypothetical protein
VDVHRQRRRWFPFPVWFAVAVLLSPASSAQAPEASAGELPFDDWILAGARRDFDWDLDIENPALRMNQRFEVFLRARIEAGDLATSETDHELTWAAVVTDREGNRLASSDPEVRTLAADIHEESALEFESWVALAPGRYVVWALLHDRTTGQLNVSREEKEIDEIRNDPLPLAYSDFPPAEFASVERLAGTDVRTYASDLRVPIASPGPLEIDLLTTLSGPEQWPGGDAFVRHVENMLDAVSALSQLDPADGGAISTTGVDLLRRAIAFEHDGAEPLERLALARALGDVNRSAISLEALLGRSENPAFLRMYVEDWLGAGTGRSGEEALRVLILVAGVMRFEDDPDLSEVRVDSPCVCRIYHLRFRQIPADLFDQVDDLLDPLDPETFDILTPRDFRGVIGRIVSDLEN